MLMAPFSMVRNGAPACVLIEIRQVRLQQGQSGDAVRESACLWWVASLLWVATLWRISTLRWVSTLWWVTLLWVSCSKTNRCKRNY